MCAGHAVSHESRQAGGLNQPTGASDLVSADGTRSRVGGADFDLGGVGGVDGGHVHTPIVGRTSEDFSGFSEFHGRTGGSLPT